MLTWRTCLSLTLYNTHIYLHLRFSHSVKCVKDMSRMVQAPAYLFGAYEKLLLHFDRTSFIRINEQYFLGLRNTGRKSHITLYQFDLAKMECKRANSVTIENATFARVCVDSKDPNRFAVNFFKGVDETQKFYLQMFVIVRGQVQSIGNVLALEKFIDPGNLSLDGKFLFGKLTSLMR
jgi:hypothetical protein